MYSLNFQDQVTRAEEQESLFLVKQELESSRYKEINAFSWKKTSQNGQVKVLYLSIAIWSLGVMVFHKNTSMLVVFILIYLNSKSC